MGQLLPPYPPDGSASSNDQPRRLRTRARCVAARVDDAARRSRSASSRLAARSSACCASGNPLVADLLLGGAKHEAIGSNNWVVDGTLTATGKPMLANDPHLATHVPSIWYLAHVSAGDFDMIGATLPGTPAVALGRNRYIAWGATNVAADVQDLYRERLDPTGRFAEFQGQQEPMTVVPETIVVKGADAGRRRTSASRGTDRSSPTRSTPTTRRRRTPPATPPLEPLAFRWTALDDEDLTVAAYMRLNEARNWNDVTAALTRLRHAVAELRVCRRRAATSATTLPVTFLFAPPATARSRPTAGPATPSGPATCRSTSCRTSTIRRRTSSSRRTTGRRARPALRWSALEYPNPYRAQRIVDLLREIIRHEEADARRLRAHPGRHGVAARARRCCRACSRTCSRRPRSTAAPSTSCAPGTTTRAATRRRRRSSRRGSCGWRRQSSATNSVRSARATKGGSRRSRASSRPRSTATRCGATTSPRPRRETCDEAVTTALHAAVEDLAERMGREPDRWRWDAVHAAVFPHQGLDSVPRAASAAQPIGAERRRLEHRERRSGRGRRAVPNSSPFPGTGKSSTCRRPTTAASSSRSAHPAISCRSTTTPSSRIGRTCATGRCEWTGWRSRQARSDGSGCRRSELTSIVRSLIVIAIGKANHRTLISKRRRVFRPALSARRKDLTPRQTAPTAYRRLPIAMSTGVRVDRAAGDDRRCYATAQDPAVEGGVPRFNFMASAIDLHSEVWREKR